MKIMYCLVVALFTLSPIHWHTDLTEAKSLAQKEHKLILLNFSGSDWCGPCMRMEKEIFGSSSFSNFSDSTLIMVNADFPRKKKNQLSSAQQKMNDALAETYNAKGIFPYTLLLNDQGKVLKSWEGLPNLKPEGFVLQIKSVLDEAR